MRLYRIITGFEEEVGYTVDHGVFKFDSYEDAVETARELAYEEYDKNAGMMGLLTYSQIKAMHLDEALSDFDEELAWMEYCEERDYWIKFNIMEAELILN